MSGGQKQRIAIARALIKDPHLLLLDEPTSALDSESEAVVQAALDNLRKDRITIIVSHRLSTIQSADIIIVLQNGTIHESGTHDELMTYQGLYYQMVVIQSKAVEQTSDDFGHIPHSPEHSVSSPEFTMFSTALPYYYRHSIGSLNHSLSHGGSASRTDSLIDDVDDESEDEAGSPSLLRLLKICKSYWPYITTGCISALIMGVSNPVYAVISGVVMKSFADTDEHAIQQNVSLMSFILLLFGVAAAIFSFFQVFMFVVFGERLTSAIRKLTFATIVHQEIEWFDQPKNSTGALCARLSSDASSVQMASGSRLSSVAYSFATWVGCVSIVLGYNWKLGLIALSFIPLMLITVYFQSRLIHGNILGDKLSIENASKVAVEATENIRVVASLHQEALFYKQYVDALKGTPRTHSQEYWFHTTKGNIVEATAKAPSSGISMNWKAKAHIKGILFAVANGCLPLACLVIVFCGISLYIKRSTTLLEMLIISDAMACSLYTIGQVTVFTPDYVRAKVSTVRIFKLLDKQSRIDYLSLDGNKLKQVAGKVDYSDVCFNYPSRPKLPILRHFNLTIEPGRTVALVGSSGCGKSTCLHLLERFYDPQGGNVMMDDCPVTNLNIAWLRSQIGIISQEPILFNYSIEENIAYGDNTRTVPKEEIVRAAQQANIHDFIQQLPEGYDTRVGEKGVQMSGGQKQRICIARALVRNPKILLLDEVTSALDSASEKAIQKALNEAKVGRTCIMIAHRLSTVQYADVIAVIRKGKVVEMGTHQQLLANKNFYYNMYTTYCTDENEVHNAVEPNEKL